MPRPLPAAVSYLGSKTPVGSALRAREWAALPLEIRETAQFSSGVESMRVMQAIQDRMMGRINLASQPARDGKTQMISRDTFINDIRRIAIEEGLTPTDPAKRGTIQDITSIPRLGMIFDIQQARAQGYAQWLSDQREGALLLYPAQELVRKERRKVPRHWLVRWQGNGGKLYGGRMVALKSDPIWTAISYFGTPWPPFDFNSGMGLVDVERDEAVRLGVMREEVGGQKPEVRGQKSEAKVEGAKPAVPSTVKGFTENLQASLKGISEELKAALKQQFGEQITLDGDTAKWTSLLALAGAIVTVEVLDAQDRVVKEFTTPVATMEYRGEQAVRELTESRGLTHWWRIKLP